MDVKVSFLIAPSDPCVHRDANKFQLAHDLLAIGDQNYRRLDCLLGSEPVQMTALFMHGSDLGRYLLSAVTDEDARVARIDAHLNDVRATFVALGERVVGPYLVARGPTRGPTLSRNHVVGPWDGVARLIAGAAQLKCEADIEAAVEGRAEERRQATVDAFSKATVSDPSGRRSVHVPLGSILGDVLRKVGFAVDHRIPTGPAAVILLTTFDHAWRWRDCEGDAAMVELLGSTSPVVIVDLGGRPDQPSRYRWLSERPGARVLTSEEDVTRFVWSGGR